MPIDLNDHGRGTVVAFNQDDDYGLEEVVGEPPAQPKKGHKDPIEFMQGRGYLL
jgi:hypothetical protein